MNNSTLKHCKHCDTNQPVENFYFNKSIACGRQATCRTCCSKRQKIAHKKLREKSQVDRLDEIDFKMIITYLKSSRVPTSERTKPELIDLWNENTSWYIPRMSDRGKDLKTMDLTE